MGARRKEEKKEKKYKLHARRNLFLVGLRSSPPFTSTGIVNVEHNAGPDESRRMRMEKQAREKEERRRREREREDLRRGQSTRQCERNE